MLPAETKPIRGSTTFIAISNTFDREKVRFHVDFVRIAQVFAKFSQNWRSEWVHLIFGIRREDIVLQNIRLYHSIMHRILEQTTVMDYSNAVSSFATSKHNRLRFQCVYLVYSSKHIPILRRFKNGFSGTSTYHSLSS